MIKELQDVGFFCTQHPQFQQTKTEPIKRLMRIPDPEIKEKAISSIEKALESKKERFPEAETEISVLSSNTISELGKKENKEKWLFFFEWFHQQNSNLLSCPGLWNKDPATVPPVLHYPFSNTITNR